ncbi:hypothetical protein [Paenibacillus polymyxa]|uniref:hypothetical protein n=1 Tax=Paenibacillus TaxID=44249 RepID=UPI0021F6ACEC|nr:hypothetical protein [Paenibacillus polymyxa]MCV9949234.1 hypothetical protein [Paenibacillus sp. BT-177]MEE4566343.1 hypothetical protein [Paenibacillus polymyxa]
MKEDQLISLTQSKTQIVETMSDFNQPLTEYLERLGLPVEGVLTPVNERKKIINALGEALECLSMEEKQKSVYLTRFTASIIAGLFDGAITYLWNETIISLRKLVIGFDLEHFYKIAESLSSRYKGLQDEEDISNISEYDLLTVCNRMELISDHVFEVFKFINYMRNHSSSAHPNENTIKAYDILSWLENCIAYAINAKPNHSSLKVKQLLHNLRNGEIPNGDINLIGGNIVKLPQQMVDDLLWTIFGLYTDEKTKMNTVENIEKIAEFVWDASTDKKKYELGEKFGHFRVNGLVIRREKAENFLTKVKGLSFRDEDSVAYDIRDTLNSLKSAHFGHNNFYNEWAWAQMLEERIPENGIVPDSVIRDWVKVIAICYSGNGLGYRDGVDEAAVRYYDKFIDSFRDREITVLVSMMNDNEMLYDTDRSTPKRRFQRMCIKLKEKTDNLTLQKCLDYIIKFPASLNKIYNASEYTLLLSKIK